MNHSIPSEITTAANADPEYEEAQKRVRKIKKFYKDLASWAGTSVFLLALDFFLSGGISWSKFPVFFYGIFVVTEVFNIIRLQRLDKAWEERQMRRFTGRGHSRNLPGNHLDNQQEQLEDYSEDLLNRKDREMEDLSAYRNLRRPWKDEDLV
ncbi:MAG: 2TM domain-containing protein [Saprospiraceae bacterium]|nr:2TM domain-containing protein [Saprospiraceae bacterium]